MPSPVNSERISEQHERDLSLDAIAGLFIILMMFRHFELLSKAPYTIGHLFFYNICWFFFKSGMYHRPVKLNRTVIMRWTRRLIVPFIVFVIFGVVLQALFLMPEGYDPYQTMYNGIKRTLYMGCPGWELPIWFLTTLFVVKIVTAEYNGGRVATIALIVGALLVAIYHNRHFSEYKYLYVGNTALGVFFYVLGYKSRDVSIKTIWYVVIGVVFALIFILAPSILDIYKNRPLHGDYYLSIIAAVCGIFLVNLLFKESKFLHISPFIFVGQNAMVFLLFHDPIAKCISTVLRRTVEMPEEAVLWISAGVTVMFCYALCYLFDRYSQLNWIIGKSKRYNEKT